MTISKKRLKTKILRWVVKAATHLGVPSDKLFAWMGNDGMKHIILSAILTVVANWLLPVWVAVVLVLLIGIIKEVYDKISGKGCAEWKDIICDIIGILIGIL